MKKLLMMLMVSAAVFSMTSCDPEKGGEGPGYTSYVDYSDGRINLVLPNSRTIEADNDGVSISVKTLEAGNVVFECRPGANVCSYYVDVIPLSLLYNTLINEKKVDAPRLEVEDVIVQLLTATSSTNGVVFSEANLEDYYSHSFDWMNSTYNNGNILSDCDYVICVVPCFDEEGMEPANVNLCWFKTPARELVGNPRVDIDYTVTYRSFSVVHEPNDDCKYICYWSYYTEQIDEYADILGDRMLRDFVRTASPAYDVANISDRGYNVDFEQSADASISQTAIAVALDINGSPADYVARRDFKLVAIPESPKAEYTILPHRSAASTFWYEVRFEASCRYCQLRWLTKAEAEEIMACTDEQKSAYVRELVSSTGGWGVSNPNFRFDATTNTPTGEGASVIEQQIVAYHPAAEYVIVSAGVNYFGEPTELKFSDPIVMKERDIENPQNCLLTDADFDVTLDNASRNGFRYNVNFNNPENIALVYFQYVSPVEVDENVMQETPFMYPPADTYNASHEEWMTYFFESYREAPDGTRSLNVNTWSTEPEDELDTPQRKSFTHFGYDTGTEYIVAYCAEDMNGVISDVRFATVSTLEAIPGPNPEAEISARLTDGEWIFTFTSNDDCAKMLYMTTSYGDANYELLALPNLFINPDMDYPTYNSIFRLWTSKITSLGLSTNSLVTYATQPKREDNTAILALCLPIGADEDGKTKAGPLQHLLIVDGQIKHLSDYRDK